MKIIQWAHGGKEKNILNLKAKKEKKEQLRTVLGITQELTEVLWSKGQWFFIITQRNFGLAKISTGRERPPKWLPPRLTMTSWPHHQWLFLIFSLRATDSTDNPFLAETPPFLSLHHQHSLSFPWTSLIPDVLPFFSAQQ